MELADRVPAAERGTRYSRVRGLTMQEVKFRLISNGMTSQPLIPGKTGAMENR